MDEKSKQAVNFRRIQEESANLIEAGLPKELAKWERAIYEAYLEVKFTPEQALELVKARMIR